MDWKATAKNIIKAEIKRKGLTYDDVREKLAAIGVQKTSFNINATINKGGFSFVFFLQIMQAIDTKTIRLD
jgi:hypothetical protein